MMKFQHNASLDLSPLLFSLSICIQEVHFVVKYAVSDVPLVLGDTLS